MKGLDMLLWVALPYISIAVFVVGHLWRYRRGQMTWTTRSTQLLERRILRIASPLFHLGLLAVVGGHVLGLIVPKAATEAVGVPEWLYHAVSVTAGTSAGIAMTTGFAILFYRRVAVPRISRTTTRADRLTYLILALAIATGMWETIGRNLLAGGYDYRETVAPWLRGLFLLRGHPELMASAPLAYQLHAISTMLLFGLWPFSRLVHVWSIPFTYPGRASILYRGRIPAAATRTRERSATAL